MDIKEIRQLRDTLQVSLGELIHAFENETSCEVKSRLEYKSPRWLTEDTPRVDLEVDISFDYEGDDADSEEIPEEAKAVTA